MPSRDYDDVIAMTDPSYQDKGDGNQKKTRKRHFHPTGDSGSQIVNAITGIGTGDYAGTLEALRYYEVADVTGTYDKQGYKLKRGDEPNREPVHLYYDSPEQADRHQRREPNPFPASEEKVDREALRARYKHWLSMPYEQQLACAGLAQQASTGVSGSRALDEW
jgi:hypothetical protein